MFIGYVLRVDPEFIEQNPMITTNAQFLLSLGNDKTDPLMQAFTIAMKTWILKSPHPARKISLFAPRDWWEHFKQRWFPRWLEERFPVEYGIGTEYEYGPIYVCPHASEKWDKNQMLHFSFLK